METALTLPHVMIVVLISLVFGRILYRLFGPIKK